MHVVSLHHLNEIEGGMLLSGAADGGVRVWRNFAHRGSQRLTTAWRVRMASHARIAYTCLSGGGIRVVLSRRMTYCQGL